MSEVTIAEKGITTDIKTKVIPIENFSDEVKKPFSQRISFSELEERFRSGDFLLKLWELHSDTLQNKRESQFSVVRTLSSFLSVMTELDHGVSEGVGGETPFGGDPLDEKDQVGSAQLEIIHVHSHPRNVWFRPSDSDFDSGVAKALRNFAKMHKTNGVTIKQLRENPSLRHIYPDMRIDLPSRIPSDGGFVETAYRPYFLILQPISETLAQVLIWHDDPANVEGQGTSQVFFDEKFGPPKQLSDDPSQCKQIIEFFQKAGFDVGIGFLERDSKGDVSFREFPSGLFLIATTNSEK